VESEAGVEVSVVVCTANRAAKLEGLLASLAAVKLPSAVRAELVLVDNASATDLAPMVERLRARLPMPVRILREPAAGLGRARNRGIETARGRILAFTDDDCLVARDWLVALWRCFESDPQLMLLGGRVELADAGDQPLTIRGGDEPETLRASRQVFGFVHGCNMALRRELLDRIGPFDSRFGAGSPLRAGEDAELVYRALRAGAKVQYQPSAVVRHDHGRRTRTQARLALSRYHQANGAILAKHAGEGDAEARAQLRRIAAGPLTSLRRRPYSALETLRACYHSAMFALGAVRSRLYARGPES
jgi:GT2 family glycosyltransferase